MCTSYSFKNYLPLTLTGVLFSPIIYQSAASFYLLWKPERILLLPVENSLGTQLLHPVDMDISI